MPCSLAKARSFGLRRHNGSSRVPFFGEDVVFSFFNSGSGSGECLSNREALAEAALLSFNDLARAPAFPACDLFCDFSFAIASSAASLPCVIPPSQRSKNAITSSQILAHLEAVNPAIRASFEGSFGRTPSARHIAISSKRYAPCCSVVRCRVSPR